MQCGMNVEVDERRASIPAVINLRAKTTRKRECSFHDSPIPMALQAKLNSESNLYSWSTGSSLEAMLSSVPKRKICLFDDLREHSLYYLFPSGSKKLKWTWKNADSNKMGAKTLDRKTVNEKIVD